MTETPLNSAFRWPLESAAIDALISEPSTALVESLRGWEGDALVLGAGGKMGLHLSQMLHSGLAAADSKATVTAVSRFRSMFDRAAFEVAGVPTLQGDLLDDRFLASLPDVPTIFYMAGAKFGTADRPDLLQTMNVDLPARVAERFKCSRIVAFSTGCVYAFTDSQSGGSTESSPVEPPGNYARSCVGREDAFIEASRRNGTPIVLIRLNYSVELRYGVIVDVAERILRGEPVDLSSGYFNAIWQSDALDYVIRAASLAASPPVPLNVTGPEILRVRDVAERLGELLGKPVTFTGTEGDTAWLGNASLCHRMFGLPQVSADQMIQWIADWLLSGGTTHGKPTGYERRDGEF